MADDTRDIAMSAKADAGAALQAVRDLKDSIDKLRDENSEQHKEARSMIRDGLSKVHSRLNTLIAGGWAIAFGIIGYLVVYGPPWVTEAQLARILEHIK